MAMEEIEGRHIRFPGMDAWLADNFPFVTESLVKKTVVL